MKRNIQQILYFFITLFLSVIAIFFILRLTPGDPVERILGEWATQEEILEYRKQLYLDQSLIKQFLIYLRGLFIGDLGVSFSQKKDVLELLKARLSPTLFMAFFSIFISTPLGIFLGVISAKKQSRYLDHFIRSLSLIALSFPIFSLAPILVLIFAIKLNWFYVSGNDTLAHYILPVMVLVTPLSSIISRVVRNKFLEEEGALWVLYLKAKGLPSLSILWRILKVCLPSILNVVALQLSVVLAGTMVTETIFDIPGIGGLLFESIQNRDYPVVQGVIIYSTTIYMTVYFIINFINEKIDPRLQKEKWY